MLTVLKTLSTPIAAGLLYGGWAYTNDYNARAFWIQASISFLVTLTIKYTVNHILSALHQHHLLIRFFSASAVSWTCISIMALAHYFGGTEAITAILIPPLIVSWAYCLAIVFSRRAL